MKPQINQINVQIKARQSHAATTIIFAAAQLVIKAKHDVNNVVQWFWKEKLFFGKVSSVPFKYSKKEEQH